MNEQNNIPETPQTPVNDGKGMSIAALVLGIVGAAGGWFGYLGFVALAAAILGIVFAVKGRKMSTAAHGRPSGLATAGLVLGIIGTVLAGIGVLACTVCAACLYGLSESVNSLML